MKKIVEFFRPTIPKIVLAILFLSWQYVENFQQVGTTYFQGATAYIATGLSFIAWNSYFVRIASLFVLWLVLAVVIYAFYLGFYGLLHGLSIGGVDFKKAEKNFLPHLVTAGGVMLFFILVFVFAPILENIRFGLLSNVLLNFQENGELVDFQATVPTIISFALTVPVWYVLSCADAWVLKQGRTEEEKEELMEEHFAVEVDEASLKDEEE